MGINAYTKSDVGKELIRVFKVLNRPYSRREYNELGNIPSRTIERTFGSWTMALNETGLSSKFDKIRGVEEKKLLERQAVEEERATFDPDEQVTKTWLKEKEDLVKRAEERKNKWLREHVLKIDLLREMLEETLAKADPPVVDVHPVKIRERKTSSERKHVTLWFEFSDLQLGTLITSEEMGGLNKHNWTIWKDKLNVWKEVVKEKIADYAETHVIDRIVIAMLGDIVEGQDIFKGQTWQIDRHVVDQAIYGANDTAAAFAEIFLSFPSLKFDILEVFGNHGRIGRKGENPYSCSMDKVFLRFMELQLKSIPTITNMKYHQNEAWFYLVSIYDWNHLLLHGDQGMSGLWSSRPTVNGLEKGITRYNQMLQQPIHFLHVGHFHNDWNLSFNMSQILINGSFIGTSTFSAQQMVAASPPIQVMHVFEPRVGLARTERIHLTLDSILAPIAPASLDGEE